MRNKISILPISMKILAYHELYQNHNILWYMILYLHRESMYYNTMKYKNHNGNNMVSFQVLPLYLLYALQLLYHCLLV